MNSKPDFSEQGYKVINQLGHNQQGGRITWLALSIATNQQVVIKQYSFAQIDSNWSGFKAHQREIDILKGLNHPKIPKYLGAFPTVNGFCLVQEYIPADSLAVSRSFEPENIKQIAIQLLEILAYLQSLIPVIIHRDIKPENILVDTELNVYLIDFGFARIGSQEVSNSSVFVGTPGFIAPEQLLKPTTATDLYALGITLICLLTGTKSTEIENLIDEDDPSQIRFRHLLPNVSLRFLDWLEMMVQPRLKERFTDAKQALNALIPLDVTRSPQVEISQQIQDFVATRLGEKIRQSITIKNVMPDTLLKGRWEVAPHPHDPSHTRKYHPWISITPTKFHGNYTRCEIQVDTSLLMADKLYKRQLFLHTNAYPATHVVNVKVQTSPMPIERRESKSSASLIWAFLTGEIATFTVLAVIPWIIALLADNKIVFWNMPTIKDSMEGAAIFGTVGAILGAVGSVLIYAIRLIYDSFKENEQMSLYNYWNNTYETIVVGMIIVGALGVIIGSIVGTIFDSSRPSDLVGIIFNVILGILMGGFYVCFLGGIAGGIIGFVTSFLMWIILSIVNDFLSLLAAVLGVSVGLGFVWGFFNVSTILALGITGIPFLYMLLYAPIQHQKLITKYRHSEKNLIKP
ncbi:serine/threonine-protein kinase [Sphaerospermopsis sp. LEGE 08334]|uniref:serine/threonine protein kinase n=1 Tax=Sphaerospermopsis sp. LEGE 08334 TaxID=1828651 RepID=UPI00187FE743|nr:serine/threonine-protein kinase [Sphaerospermopsis sp. LEGE 08334]MBE9058281.1 serine/threonine-protein kinase [Sphaerospermopsis sp. LEGE 08334]